MPARVLTVLWFAVGASVLVEWLERRWRFQGWKRLVLLALLACVPLYNVLWHYPETLDNRKIDTRAESLAILGLPLPGGAVVAGRWSEITRLRYLQRVEGVRPDLWVVHAAEAGIHDVLLPEAVAQETPLYVLRGTQAGLRLLPLPSYATVPTSQPADMLLGEVARWRGFDLPGGAVAPGGALPLTLYWQAEAPIDQNWKSFLHLLNAQGGKVAQVDRVPLEGFHPPTEWQTGCLLADQYELALPSDLPAGRYQLIFGWYNESDRFIWEDGQDFQYWMRYSSSPGQFSA